MKKLLTILILIACVSCRKEILPVKETTNIKRCKGVEYFGICGDNITLLVNNIDTGRIITTQWATRWEAMSSFYKNRELTQGKLIYIIK